MEYSVAIRTLGTAGEKYQRLLESLERQTVPPEQIVVYIAEGYPVPEETIGKEQYVYVRKGMVAQRALRYDEIDTEYILFLDDDLVLGPDTVESMYEAMVQSGADVVAPDIFRNSGRGMMSRMLMFLSGRMVARHDDGRWGYKVMRNAGYSYNRNPKKKVYMSQTNAGACLLCRKSDFLSIRFDEELWLDNQGYALGEDQTMYYKMYRKGLKVATLYDCDIEHLDAGDNLNPERERRLIYADFRFKTIFWHRFIFMPEKSCLMKVWDCLCIGYAIMFTLTVSLLKCRFLVLKTKYDAVRDACAFIRSPEYRSLPLIG